MALCPRGEHAHLPRPRMRSKSCINDSQWKTGAFLTNSYGNPKKFRSRKNQINFRKSLAGRDLNIKSKIAPGDTVSKWNNISFLYSYIFRLSLPRIGPNSALVIWCRGSIFSALKGLGMLTVEHLGCRLFNLPTLKRNITKQVVIGSKLSTQRINQLSRNITKN